MQLGTILIIVKLVKVRWIVYCKLEKKLWKTVKKKMEQCENNCKNLSILLWLFVNLVWGHLYVIISCIMRCEREGGKGGEERENIWREINLKCNGVKPWDWFYCHFVVVSNFPGRWVRAILCVCVSNALFLLGKSWSCRYRWDMSQST